MPNITKQIVQAITATVAIIWAGLALSYLIFGILGKTREDDAWLYAAILYMVLGVATIGVSGKLLPRYRLIGSYLSSLAAGAILGFFFVGWVAEESPLWASVGAIAGGLVGAIACNRSQKKGNLGQIISLALNCATTVTVYGFGLLTGTNAIALLVAGQILGGISWSAIALYSLWLTLKAGVNTRSSINLRG